jgi:5-methylcytosine-specific restriction enzyme A
MPKLRKLAPLLRTIDLRTAKPPVAPITPQQRFKRADPIYASPEFRAWRAKVIARAGGRCEAMAHGQRCTKAQPVHRMFADHIIELTDRGAPFDVANGQCLCGPHHLMKTAQSRHERLARGGGSQNVEVARR